MQEKIKMFFSIVLILLIGNVALWAQNETEVYNFEELSLSESDGYNSQLGDTPYEVQGIEAGVMTNVYQETARFCDKDLNGRFAFEKDDAGTNKFILSAGSGLNMKGGKNYVWAILGLKKGETVHIEYNNSSKREMQVLSGNVAWITEDGTMIDLSGKTGKGKDARILATGEASYDFVMQSDGNLSFCVGTSFVACIKNVTITPKVESKVCYIYDSTYPDYSEDTEYAHLIMTTEGDADSWYLDTTNLGEIEDIDISKVTLDEKDLQNKNLVVLSPSLKADESQAATLKKIIGYVPMLNLGTNLYSTWGYGNPVETSTNLIKVENSAVNNALFFHGGEPLYEESLEMEFITDNAIVAIEPTGDYFVNDKVLARADDNVAIHVHNENRNAYMLLPCNKGAGDDNMFYLIGNAISNLQKTKRDIVEANTPTYTVEYQNQKTIVTLDSKVQNSTIYYTIDGTEPTTESNVYTEPIIIEKEGIVIQAIAVAEGYLTSSVMISDIIEIKEQVKTPTINVTKNDNNTTVTLCCGTPGAYIYYNYTGSNLNDESALYNEPITLTRHAKITVFAQLDGMVQSESTSELVRVDGEVVRIDTLAWMNGSDACYGNTTLITEYDFDPDSLTYMDFGNGWALGSNGQRVISQRTSGGVKIGAGSYGPATVDDWGFSYGCISFQFCKNEEDPSSAWLQTTNKIQGPFDIYIWTTGQIDASWENKLEVTISTDSLNWQLIDTLVSTGKKNQVKHIRSYEGNAQVYVKVKCVDDAEGTKTKQKTNVNDILLLAHGKLSEAFENEGTRIQGDVNGDKIVDISDVNAVISVICGNGSYDYADVNGDGVVDISDVNAVIAIICGK